jgi:large subunit ribosomal protein L16
MFVPAKTKWRKAQRGRMKGIATRCNTVTFGDYGLQAIDPGWIDSKHIEAARIALTKFIKRGGKIWIRIFPDKPYTRHPAESRMGKGKGTPEGWVAVVKPGTVMFEMAGVQPEFAKEALARAAQKLPIRSRFMAAER